MEAAVKAVKMEESLGTDSIEVELVKAGVVAMIERLTKACNKILNTGEWPTEWIKCLVILLPRKRNFVALPKLRNSQPHHKSKQIHVEDYPNQTSARSGKGYSKLAS